MASSAAHPCVSTRLLLKLRSPSPIIRMRSRASKGIIGSWCCCCFCVEGVVFLSVLRLACCCEFDCWCFGREGPSRTLNFERPLFDFSLCSLRSCSLRRFDLPMLMCNDSCLRSKVLFSEIERLMPARHSEIDERDGPPPQCLVRPCHSRHPSFSSCSMPSAFLAILAGSFS